MLLNPVNRGVAMGYSRWAGGAVEQRDASLGLGLIIGMGAVFGTMFLSMFICVAIMMKASWILILFGVFAPIGVAALLAKKVLELRTNSRINQRFAHEGGTLLGGEITSARIRHTGSSRQHTRHRHIGIEYRFQAPDGQMLTGKGMSRYETPKGSVLPPPGTRVAVLYLDERHYKAL
jgi:hypothetical protein